MSKYYMQDKSIYITGTHAEGMLPYLKWIAEEAPQKKYRVAAKTLLTKIRGIKDWRQILLTRGEEEVLDAVHNAFPYQAIEPKQLRMKDM